MTKRAFTLVELLVVVGIMATMGTMSIGGYFAIARGMADRGAFATATSVISLAQERAHRQKKGVLRTGNKAPKQKISTAYK